MDSDLLLLFFSIIAGLGLADLITSLHRLLRARKLIKWHWIPMVHAFAAFQGMINIWYNVSIDLSSPLVTTSLGFFIWLIPIILLLLIMLAVLPDHQPNEPFDIYSWYIEHRKYYYTLLTLFILSISINRSLIEEAQSYWYLPLILVIPFAILIFTKKFWLHALVTVLIVLFLLGTLAIQLMELS
ncbi:MAG: hypothetical protein OEQ81_13130 [Flavobacteriaceae bacterium]|nr:hypothetical protein [Flavobacteriaceae bacterium]